MRTCLAQVQKEMAKPRLSLSARKGLDRFGALPGPATLILPVEAKRMRAAGRLAAADDSIPIL